MKARIENNNIKLKQLKEKYAPLSVKTIDDYLHDNSDPETKVLFQFTFSSPSELDIVALSEMLRKDGFLMDTPQTYRRRWKNQGYMETPLKNLWAAVDFAENLIEDCECSFTSWSYRS